MHFVALISGGKDSLYAAMECVRRGHTLAAFAHLTPLNTDVDDTNSYCFQTIGHQLISTIATKCVSNVPLIQRTLLHGSNVTAMAYEEPTTTADSDEVEDLFALIQDVIQQQPDIRAVCSGAILSNYQRLRIEHVCARLGLISLAPLWQRSQSVLLQEMIASQLEAILIKVSADGLRPADHCGRSIRELYPQLIRFEKTYGLNVCGEGGEYESLVTDCPLFHSQLIIDEAIIVTESNSVIAPVGYYRITQWHVKAKAERIPITLLPIMQPPTVTTTPVTWKAPIPIKSIFPDLRRSGKHLVYIATRIPISSQQTNNNTQDAVNHVLQSVMTALRDKCNDNDNSFTFEPFYLTVFLHDMTQFTRMNEAYSSVVPRNNPPSRSCIQAAQPFISIDCMAVRSSITTPIRQTLHVQSISDWSAACIGPYSQSNIIHGIIFGAGQIGLNACDMILVPINQQLSTCFINYSAVISVLQSQMNHIFMLIIYIDLSQYISDNNNNNNNNITNFIKECEVLLLHYHITIQPLYIVVPALPRRAMCEIQAIHYQHHVLQSLIQTYNDDNNDDDTNNDLLQIQSDSFELSHSNISLLTNWTWIPQYFSSFLIYIPIIITRNQTIIIDLLTQSFNRILNQSKLSFDYIFTVRVYTSIRSSITATDVDKQQDTDDNRFQMIHDMLLMAITRVSGSNKPNDLPAVSFIPVEALPNIQQQSKPAHINHDVCLHILLWNIDTIH